MPGRGASAAGGPLQRTASGGGIVPRLWGAADPLGDPGGGDPAGRQRGALPVRLRGAPIYGRYARAVGGLPPDLGGSVIFTVTTQTPVGKARRKAGPFIKI